MCVPKKSGGIRITVNYQTLNKVTGIPQIAIPRVDEVLDTLGGGSVFSVFDLFSGFTQLTIHPDTIPLTAFCTPNGLYEWLGMPQGAAGAPAWFVSVMRLVTAGLDNIRMYLDDAIGSDDCPIHHVVTLATFFACLHLHKLKLSPDKSRIGDARVDFLGHVISADGVRPNDDRVTALTRIPMPTDIKQLRSLLGGLSYYAQHGLPHPPDNGPSQKGRCIRFHLPNGGYRSCPFRGTRGTTDTRLPGLGRGHRHVSALPPSLRRQHRWPRNHPRTRTAGWLYAPSSISAKPPSTMSRTGPPWNSKPDASCGALDASYIFGVYFLVFTDHQCLQKICKIGETKPRIQRWMEFLSAYNFRLSYRRGEENANADSLSRLPLPPIE